MTEPYPGILQRREGAITCVYVFLAKLVSGQGVRNTSYDRVLVGTPREVRKMFADLHAWYVRLHRLECPPNLCRSIGFHIERIEV